MGKSKDTRYRIIGNKHRAMSRWYMIYYRTHHTDENKNRFYKNVEFDLDKDEFIEWFMEHDFEGASVDRIDNSKGYTMDNIQLILLDENIRKDKIKAKDGWCVCFSCKQRKKLEFFSKDKRRINGHSTICKECDNKRKRVRSV